MEIINLLNFHFMKITPTFGIIGSKIVHSQDS